MDTVRVEVFGPPDAPLCYIYRPATLPDRTMFPGPANLPLQVGYVVHRAGHEIPRHVHTPLPRQSVGTPEVLLVMSGRCALDIYDDRQLLVATTELERGDVMIMVGGGHGFRMLEDTVLLEVKQGPYAGPAEKERF